MWYAFYEVSPYAYFNDLESYTLEGDEIKFIVEKDKIRFIGCLTNKHVLIAIPVGVFINHNANMADFDGYVSVRKL